jgi:uncharacterized protein (TIGR03435 family)
LDVAGVFFVTDVSDDEIKRIGYDQRDASKARFLSEPLADRFQLKVYRETKEVPVYALIVGGSGPKIKNAADGDVTHQVASRATCSSGDQ